MKKSYLLFTLISAITFGSTYLFKEELKEAVTEVAKNVDVKESFISQVEENKNIASKEESEKSALFFADTTHSFTEDFEGDVSAWTLSNGASLNKWMVGTAAHNGGANGLYISNDNGVSNLYSNTATTVHAYREFQMPAVVGEAMIKFDWRAQGEGNWDYLRVWVVPATYTPTVGTLISPGNSGGVQLSGMNYNVQNTWQTEQIYVDLSAFAGQNIRVVFEWRNDGSVNVQPPAAIDNIEFVVETCFIPTNVQTSKNLQGDIVITWEPANNETQWEIYIVEQGQPAPGANTQGIVVQGTPSYIYTNVQEGVVYEVYIRTICTEEDNSRWTEPINFSDFTPPACVDLEIGLPNLPINDNGDYYICSNETTTINLSANYDENAFKATTSYEIESIDYAPPYPFIGGTTVPIQFDDDYTSSFNLPFDFCFFENSYSFCRVGDNGVVTFGLPYTTTFGDDCPFSVPNTPLPNAGFPIKNAIYGIYKDLDVTNNPDPQLTQINYQVLGTYPCRALVVNFNEVPTWGGSCSNPQYRTTTQIVLYEITNIIEIYVNKVKPCSGSTSSGRQVMGIQNAAGTIAYTPPNRNVGVWEATQEAWRFKPTGESVVTFGWYMNGQLISQNNNISVEVSEDAVFEAVITYPACGGEDVVLRKGFTVKVSEEIDLVTPDDIELCEEGTVDLTQVETQLLSNLNDLSEIFVTYYETQEDADAKQNAIVMPEAYVYGTVPKIIYIRVDNTDSGCYNTTQVNLVQKASPVLAKLEDMALCVYNGEISTVDMTPQQEKIVEEYTSAEIQVAFYTSQANAQNGTNPIADITAYQPTSLPQTIYVRTSGDPEVCDGLTSFNLIEGEKWPLHTIADIVICDGYVLPALPTGYYYTTGDLGTGEQLAVGSSLTASGIHEIYINSVSEDGCVSSYKQTIEVVKCQIQKGISPNGDGLNDSFDLTTFHATKVSIYNRYGTEVYSYGAGYTNQWVGQDKAGNKLPDGTYFYKVQTSVSEYTGYVYLNREVK